MASLAAIREKNGGEIMQLFKTLTAIISAASIGISAAIAANAPSVTLQSVLDYQIYNNGGVRIDKTDLAFAPTAPLNAQLIVRTKAGEDVASWPFFDNYRVTEAVFGRMSTTGGAIQSFDVGEYAFDYVVDGAVATSIPFSVVPGTVSDDPFNPQSTVKFVGPWQQWAYLAPNTRGSDSAAAVHFWAGSSDLPDGQTRAPFVVKVERDGVLIAHSNPRTGHINHRPISHNKAFLQEPHEADKSHLAKNVALAELQKDGNYKVTVELADSGTVIRTYQFASGGGQITPHPRTTLNYQPNSAYIAPRATVRGSTTYEFEAVHWIESPQ